MATGGGGDGGIAPGADDPGCATMGASGGSGCVTTGGAGGVTGAGGAGRAAAGVRAAASVAGRCRPSDNGDGAAHADSNAAAAIITDARAQIEAERNSIGRGCVEVTEQEPFRALARTLYVVATPLGNLRDVTLRALDVLRTADVIAAEDTRVSAVLLRHYGIATRPLSVHAHNEARRAVRVIDLLREGRSVALVSDAGTPAVSDPGARLVAAVRDAGYAVVPIPGANAAAAAVSVAGLAAERFVFLGFLPSSAKARRELLSSVASLPFALVVYEAPHRVRDTVSELLDALGGERVLAVAREITKKFETITRLRLADAPAWFAAEANRERGEFVLIVDAPAAATGVAEALTPQTDRLLRALNAELPPARAARVAAAATGLSRETLYARARALKPASGDGDA